MKVTLDVIRENRPIRAVSSSRFTSLQTQRVGHPKDFASGDRSRCICFLSVTETAGGRSRGSDEHAVGTLPNRCRTAKGDRWRGGAQCILPHSCLADFQSRASQNFNPTERGHALRESNRLHWSTPPPSEQPPVRTPSPEAASPYFGVGILLFRRGQLNTKELVRRHLPNFAPSLLNSRIRWAFVVLDSTRIWLHSTRPTFIASSLAVLGWRVVP